MKQKYLKTKRYYNKYGMRYEPKIRELILDDNDLVISKNYLKTNTHEHSFKYYIFRESEEYLDYIKNHRNTDLFEDIRDDRPKIYFDIDLPKEYVSEGLFKREVKFIVKEIVRLFNLYFNVEITSKDLLIYVRDETDEMIRSIHIIIPKYRSNKQTIKKFVELCSVHHPNGITNNLYLDNQVYHNGHQNLCLPYQTKTKYGGKRVLIPFNKTTAKNESVDKYCCNITDGVAEADISEVYACIDWMMGKVEDELSLDIEYETINRSNQIKKDDDDTIQLNQYDLVDYLMNKLPNEFYKKNSKWCSYTAYLKLYGIEGMDNWLLHSADKSEGEYTLTDNKKWLDNITDNLPHKNINNFINKFIGGLNKEYPSLNIWFGLRNTFDTKELREWISKRTEMEINSINTLFNNTKPSADSIFMDINGEWKLYITALDLVHTETETKYNYWVDEVYAKINDDKEYNTNDEIYHRLNDFLGDGEKIFNINAKWGSGKTHIFIKNAIKTAISNGWRVLMISENNVLNRSITQQLTNDYGNIVKNHIQIRDKKRFAEEHRICISSTESIQKTFGGVFDLIILDEFESVFNHYESLGTHKYTTPYKSCCILEDKLKLSKKIITLDADLSLERLKIVYDALQITHEPKIYFSDCNKWKEYKFNIYFKKYEMIKQILDDIKNGKNIAVACMSKTMAEQIAKYIETKIPNTKTLCIWSDVCKMNGEDIEKSEAVKDNIECVIQENKIQVWIYSPSVKTGLSINTPNYFHKTFMITKQKKSCCGREALQMIFRTRDLIDKDINILLPKLKHIVPSVSKKRAELHLTSNLRLSKITDDKPIDTDTNKIHFETKDFYKNIRVLNILEWYDSEYNLGHEVLRRLTKNHNIPVNIIHEKIMTYGEIHEDLGKIKTELKFNKMRALNRDTDLIDKEKYDMNEEEKRSKIYTSKMLRENQKRFAMNSIGVNPRWNEYRETERGVELNQKWGYVYYGDEDKPKKKFNYTNIIDGLELDGDEWIKHKNTIEFDSNLYDILLSDKKHIIYNIKNSNKYCKEDLGKELEPAINSKNQSYIKWNCDRRILCKLLPKIYIADKINLDGFEMTAIEFNKTMMDNTELIRKDFNFYECVYSVKEGFDWKTFNASNTNHKKEYYKFLQRVIGKYGLELVAPVNKKRDNSIYKCVVKKHTIQKDHHIPFIHRDYYNKRPFETDKLLIDNDDILRGLYTENQKTRKITTNKKKDQKAFFQEHAPNKNYPTSLQLYKRDGNKWKREGNEWKIEGKLTILKSYEDPKIKIETKVFDCDKDPYKEISKLARKSLITHYSKFRINESDKETNHKLREKYNYCMRKEIQKDNKKCIIESDSDSEDEEPPNEPTESETESNDY